MTEKKTAAQKAATAAGTPAASESEVAKPSAPVYRDKAYTSRTLILEGGGTAKVVAGKIEASDALLLAFLDAHEDFERVAE